MMDKTEWLMTGGIEMKVYIKYKKGGQEWQ